MKTERLTPDPDGIARAAELLAAGQTVAMPTETVYGLAGDARNGRAVARIFEAKGRPGFNPLIVHFPHLAAARDIASFGDEALILAQTFWPGALTLVLDLHATSDIAPLVTAGLDTVGIRLPDHPPAPC